LDVVGTEGYEEGGRRVVQRAGFIFRKVQSGMVCNVFIVVIVEDVSRVVFLSYVVVLAVARGKQQQSFGSEWP